MAAVYYPISKPSSGELITAAKFNEIASTLNSECIRRGQAAPYISTNTAITVNASFVNTVYSYINSWTGSSYSVAAGAPITPTHIHWMIDGLNAAGSNPLIVQIPSSGSYSAYFNFAYQYGRPAVISWSSNGSTLWWNVTSYTSYCGSAKAGSGSVAITQTTYGGQPVQTANWAFFHRKDCCSGNQNYMWEYYTLTMTNTGAVSITAYSVAGGQSGC